MKIGFVGLGHMGTPMVKNLLMHHDVTVFDLVDDAVNSLVTLGATRAHSLSDLASDADVVFTMLQTGEQVKKCCLGEAGIFLHLNKKSALYIDCSSIDIHTSRELHAAAKSRDIQMCDAPVSGGVAAAQNATLTFMVGGDENHFNQAQTVLSAMGKKIIYAGLAGSGAAAKICNNMILGISMIGVSEAFVLAEKLGLDAKKLFEISSNASGQCWSLTQYCPSPNILPNVPSSHEYQPGFTAKMMLKDLQLSQDAASTVHAETPLGKHAMELYAQFVNASKAEIDFSGIIQMLKKA